MFGLSVEIRWERGLLPLKRKPKQHLTQSAGTPYHKGKHLPYIPSTQSMDGFYGTFYKITVDIQE
jgi:hypothetical protein